MAGERVAQLVRRKVEHYKVLSVVNDFSGDSRTRNSITVGAVARRAGVSPDRALEVLTRRESNRRRRRVSG